MPQIDYPEHLPTYVKLAVLVFYNEHPEYHTQEGSAGQCHEAATQFVEKLKTMFPQKDFKAWVDGEPVDVIIGGVSFREPHSWAIVSIPSSDTKTDYWQIDFTYRQFDPQAACPKIWK